MLRIPNASEGAVVDRRGVRPGEVPLPVQPLAFARRGSRGVAARLSPDGAFEEFPFQRRDCKTFSASAVQSFGKMCKHLVIIAQILSKPFGLSRGALSFLLATTPRTRKNAY